MIRLFQRQKRNAESGNIIVLMTMLLTLLFVIGGIAVETTLYLLRRAELQSLAEAVALGSVMSFPSKTATLTSAQSWYDALRKEDVREIAPAATVNSDNGALALFTVTFDDNASSAGVDEPYVVNSVTVSISVDYQPKIFPVLGARPAYEVVGQATAQLRPTDVVIVLDNSGAFYDQGSFSEDATAASISFPEAQVNLASQCYSDSWRNFKSGAVLLYDLLSQIGTYRVSVITTTSRTEEPYILIPLGSTKMTASELEYDKDQPYNHSTFCAGLARSELSDNAVPKNPNDDSSPTWQAREHLNKILETDNLAAGIFKMANSTNLLSREALWMLKAGYLTQQFMHPKYIFVSPVDAFKVGAMMLTNSRRDDNLPIGQRAVIGLVGSDGLSFDSFGWEEDPQAANSVSEFEDPKLCQALRSAGWGDVKYGVLYFGHHSSLPHHDPSKLDDFRSNCLIPGTENTGIFFGEVSSETSQLETEFRKWLIPRVAHGLKQAELVR